MNNRKLGTILLSLLGLLSLSVLFCLEPIIQNEDYHNFSDRETILGIPHFWNAISNLPFLIAGLYGILKFKHLKKINQQFIIFFLGITLVSLGSGYYHLCPNSSTLIWDRLPMTVAFTGLMSIMISQFINNSAGEKLLIPLISVGLLSILFWVKYNDLRPYVFVQFYPLIAIPILLILFKKPNQNTNGYWLLLAAYILAKLFETFDYEIHETLHFISGHSLKHIAAGLGVFLWIKSES